ncbi:MAG: sigma-70 family RNA polymerase sigma factor [Planctomycetes bacterium]|nr:sigma-70 family RNA polymerase sigma factor [Planctomycetota bacterium]NOG53453.1 sigma-70 family RNA polymerase sigma factor [Planctomycetota bacterium]
MAPNEPERAPDADTGTSMSDEVISAVYDELRRIAQHMLQHERPGHTLQATALVNEAYLRLAANSNLHWEKKEHFLATAAMAIRRILIDHARARNRLKRGGGALRVTLNEAIAAQEQDGIDVLELDEALVRLAEFDERKARIVELKFFGGLTTDEVAAVLGLSDRMIRKDWALARAWLSRELGGERETL